MSANAAARPLPADPAIILASGSATRRRLLSAAGVAFETRPAAIDELSLKRSAQAQGMDPDETALLLAELKASRVRAPGAVVIGADQLLRCGERWFDKPEDVAAARAQLQALRGRVHHLHTAVTVIRDGRVIFHHQDAPRLHMRTVSDAWLEAYLEAEGEAVLGCVGGYRLEGRGVQLFDRVEGDYFSVLGLPLLPLLGFLRQHGAIEG